MPDQLTRDILTSQEIIVPFDEVAGGKQVSVIVCFSNRTYSSYALIDSNDEYLGPIEVVKTDIPSESIAVWLNEQKNCFIAIRPARVDQIRSSFWLNGEIKTVIEGFDFWDSDGQLLTLRRMGSAYPYGLLLTVVPIM